MCRICGYRNESTHLLYWAFEWQKRFVTTLWHFVNRRAYHKWQSKRTCTWQQDMDRTNEDLRKENKKLKAQNHLYKMMYQAGEQM